ncbi:ribosomal protection-like ABC-F family protein [Bacillus changyiensis]|uniref:ribosomal protection-like ABC-F family protein n=1 Tax=Bacillus changyiensis TaxID=3004103 RepID=UPI0022DEAF10|nr:ABC-F type ribosomal protection protein [Bacillus changyiensis]MDA1475098.1 ABC-F type ribosomal protection protein [Bacillus changyiensis]
MTVLMKVSGLQKSFGDQHVLKNIQFQIKQGERIGLVGLNGTGKTTIANILSGHVGADDGSIQTESSLKIGYLEQSIDYSINDFYHILTEDGNGDLFQMTSQLGLEIQNWQNEKIHHLSGGEKLKLALASVWKTAPDLLILDEPTNHLDLNGINWLIEELKTFTGAVLMISHDRYFLDQSVSTIFELENGELDVYQGNYSAYNKEKKRLFEVYLHQYKVQQKQTDKIESQIAKFQNWSEKAHRESTKKDGFKEYYRVKAKKLDNQAKSKINRLKKELEKHKLEKPQEEAINFQFVSSEKRGKRIYTAKNVTKAFNGRMLFTNSNFYIQHGERIGLIGHNGCGKTTLIRMMLGMEQATDGTLWKSPSVKVAYLSQDVSDLKEEQSVREILQLSDEQEIKKARTILANMGIKKERFHRKIETFSLGERTKIKLASLMLKDYHVLILDEPTNHLDLPSREQLEETLLKFAGSIIIVSHDVYFIEKLCDKFLIFEEGCIKRVETGMQVGQQRQKQPIKEELLKIENRIAVILAELADLSPQDQKYAELDQEYLILLKRKQTLDKQI